MLMESLMLIMFKGCLSNVTDARLLNNRIPGGWGLSRGGGGWKKYGWGEGALERDRWGFAPVMIKAKKIIILQINLVSFMNGKRG